MAIVVTGFEPFGDHKTNASWSAVRLLPAIWGDTQPPVEVREIPVAYGWVQEQEEAVWREPVFTVHVGVSGRDSVVTLEAGAHNTGYCRPDNRAACPEEGECVAGGREEETTCLDMARLLEGCREEGGGEGIDFQVSEDAGRYLCDFVYYRSLHCSSGRSLFIHVPPLDQPYTAAQLAIAIAIVLKQIVKMRT